MPARSGAYGGFSGAVDFGGAVEWQAASWWPLRVRTTDPYQDHRAIITAPEAGATSRSAKPNRTASGIPAGPADRCRKGMTAKAGPAVGGEYEQQGRAPSAAGPT